MKGVSKTGHLYNHVVEEVTQKKSRLARLQVGTSVYAVNQCPLRDLDGLGDLLLRLGLRHRDGQDAVLHFGRNLVFQNIVRQLVVLLVV